MHSVIHEATPQKGSNLIGYIIAGSLAVLLMFTLATSQHNNRVHELEQKVDSIQTEADGLRTERDSLDLLYRGARGTMKKATVEAVQWTTRAVLSETKRPSEMLYVANVIRNRLDMSYRGAETVKEVVLDRYQFSAFNPGREERWRYMNMDGDTYSPDEWEQAWEISKFVMSAPRDALPLRDVCINHFYYPGVNYYSPRWVDTMEQVDLGDVHLPRVVFFRQNGPPSCQ